MLALRAFTLSAGFGRGRSRISLIYSLRCSQKAEACLPDGTKSLMEFRFYFNLFYGLCQRPPFCKIERQAFFDVVRDSKRQFDVSVGDVKVLVHGMAFDVNGYGDHSELEVVLL